MVQNFQIRFYGADITTQMVRFKQDRFHSTGITALLCNSQGEHSDIPCDQHSEGNIAGVCIEMSAGQDPGDFLGRLIRFFFCDAA